LCRRRATAPPRHGSELLIRVLHSARGPVMAGLPVECTHPAWRGRTMHSLRGKRGLIGGLIFALAAAVALPVPAHAGPDPAAKRQNTSRYRLFAGNLGAITTNRFYYGLNTRGEVGVDSLNSSTIGGGFWPKGTGNQYMFNSRSEEHTSELQSRENL